ncbi:hypothetical protein [Streptomyces sp. NPDC012510]|uniref:hypothetical protein n=1 Tax=Streptomyces sp. NPDC012510 TaxID=3364838 RepID=UPI0036E56082
MSRADRRSEPIAVHVTEWGGRRVVIVVHPNLVTVRDASHGDVLARHSLPYSAENTACVNRDASALLVANDGAKVFTHDLEDGKTEHIGSCASHITALAAANLGEKPMVAVGDQNGSVGLFTLHDTSEWSLEPVPAHQNTVLSVALGEIRGRPSVISCANDMTVTHTTTGKNTSRNLWTLQWAEDGNWSTGLSCTWRSYGKEYPEDFGRDLRDQALLRAGMNSAYKALRKRRETVQICSVVDVGSTSLALINGKYESASMMTAGEVPGRSEVIAHTVACKAPGRLAAVLPVRGGARLAWIQGSVIHVESLQPIRAWYWFHRALDLAASCSGVWLFTKDPGAWFVLPFTLPMGARAFRRPSVRGVSTRVLADIDLHSEVIDVAFDGPEGLVALSHQGLATFDLREPKA